MKECALPYCGLTNKSVSKLLTSLIFSSVLGISGCGSSDSDEPATQSNRAPISNAGVDQSVVLGSTVSLNGSISSDPDGDELSYQWSFISKPTGSSATLDDTTSTSPKFTANVSGEYVVQLIVNDGTKSSAADTLTVNVIKENNNVVPVAEAGENQSVATNSIVTLNGADSIDANGDSLTFQWTLSSIPANSSATLSNSTSVSPSFLADLSGSYVLQLIVNDGAENSDTDVVTITASQGNSAPIARAGSDQNVTTGTLVRLDGSASSDINGDTLSYNWSFEVPGEGKSKKISKVGKKNDLDIVTGVLDDPTSVTPSFTADKSGLYKLLLIVSDGKENSIADSVSITATQGNVAPIANAGQDQNVSIGSIVSLVGTESTDADGDPLSFQWSMTSVPTNSSAALENATAETPTFTADLEGVYVVQLIVNDGSENSVADTISVTATFENSPPIANAGNDQFVAPGSNVYLDASSSLDNDGDALLYQWTLVSKPSGSVAVLDDASVFNPSFVADIYGNYVFSLTVNDGLLDSSEDTLVITASDGSVKLFSRSFDSNYTEVPFSSSKVVVTDLSIGSTNYMLVAFKLAAQSVDLTVSNLQAKEKNDSVSPFFSGLKEGDEIKAGEELVFQLMSPLINDTSVQVTFNFEIAETGDVFFAEYEVIKPNVVTPIVQVLPKYPVQAARDGEEGWVKLGFTVNEVGGVDDIEVLDAEPKRIFDREAERALSKWKYKPRVVDGSPVKTEGLSVVLEFELED